MKKIIGITIMILLTTGVFAQANRKQDGDSINKPLFKTDSIDFKSKPPKNTPPDTSHIRIKKRIEYIDTIQFDDNKPKIKSEVDTIK